MSRLGLLWLLLVLATLLTACDLGISIRFVNKTDSDLCFFESTFESPRESDLDPELCNKIQPQDERSYSVICESDWLMWVLLTDGVGGRQIYGRSATCGDWEDSGATVTVEQRDGEFVVTDSLPDASPTSEGD